jgi:hypothetical protein
MSSMSISPSPSSSLSFSSYAGSSSMASGRQASCPAASRERNAGYVRDREQTTMGRRGTSRQAMQHDSLHCMIMNRLHTCCETRTLWFLPRQHQPTPSHDLAPSLGLYVEVVYRGHGYMKEGVIHEAARAPGKPPAPLHGCANVRA